jgi:hypothetical protein
VKVTYAGGIAQVRVDGRTYGYTPLVIRLDAGQRFISLVGNAYTPSQIVLEIQPGDTAVAAFKVPAATRRDSGTNTPPASAPTAATVAAPPPTSPPPVD